MDVTVKLFSTFRQVTGLRETTLRLPEGATVDALLVRLLEAHPELATHRGSMILAVNQEFAAPATKLRSKDEVALLPPVSGGGPPRGPLPTGTLHPLAGPAPAPPPPPGAGRGFPRTGPA